MCFFFFFLQNILRFWFDKGIDGFRIDAMQFLIEDKKFRDEPISKICNDIKNDTCLIHIFTRDQNETYDMVRQWRDVADEYLITGSERIIITESWSSVKKTMKYYDYGAHFPFNFGLITDVDKNSNAIDFKNVIDTWIEHLPPGKSSNWVVNN